MIVLICTQFPYKGSESFLESEISVWGKTDEEVRIYPLSSIETETVKLPKNVKFINIPKMSKGKMIICTIKSVLSSDFWKEFIYVIRTEVTIKKLLSMIIYQGKIAYYTSVIKKDLKENKIDKEDVILYSYWMHIHACIAARLKKKLNIRKWVTRAHGYDLYEFRSSSGYLPERKKIFEIVDIVASVSDKGRKYVLDKYSFADSKKIITSYLGTFSKGKNPFDGSVFRIVSVANMVDVKRIDKLIFTLKQIKDIKIEWIHFGDGILMNHLISLATQNLPTNIKYHFMGQVDNQELLLEYARKSINCLISTSSSEGLPVSFMEAMSFGIPVISTNVGGCSEIVIDNYNGKLVPSDIDDVSFSKVIRDFLTLDYDEKLRIRKNARLTWEEKFSAEKNYLNFIKLIMRR